MSCCVVGEEGHDASRPVNLESRLLRIAYVSAKPVTILSRAFAHALSGFLKTPPDLYEHLHPSLQDESKMMCSRPR